MCSKRKQIGYHLDVIWSKIGIDKPSNHEDIHNFIYEDVCDSADTDNWTTEDVGIALRRWIESKSINARCKQFDEP